MQSISIAEPLLQLRPSWADKGQARRTLLSTTVTSVLFPGFTVLSSFLFLKLPTFPGGKNHVQIRISKSVRAAPWKGRSFLGRQLLTHKSKWHRCLFQVRLPSQGSTLEWLFLSLMRLPQLKASLPICSMVPMESMESSSPAGRSIVAN